MPRFVTGAGGSTSASFFNAFADLARGKDDGRGGEAAADTSGYEGYGPDGDFGGVGRRGEGIVWGISPMDGSQPRPR